MKAPFIIWLILLVLGGLVPSSLAGEFGTFEDVRRALRKEGFKTDLSEFDFAVPKEMQNRSAAVCTDGLINPQRLESFLNDNDLLVPAGHRAAIVVWRQEQLAYPSGARGYLYLYEEGTGTNMWPAFHEMIEDATPDLDAAAAAALSGPIGFNLEASSGSAMLLRHLPGLKYYIKMLGGRAMLALHEGNTDIAWTNLLAATRLVTAWQTEPAEISQHIRLDCLGTVYNLTWQALQSGKWTDSQLIDLQQEWEKLDLFNSIPEVYAFKRASEVAECQRQHGSEAAQMNILVFYRDREIEARRAIQSRSWAQMRLLPGVTNAGFLEVPAGNLPSAMQVRLGSRRMSMSVQFVGWEMGLYGRAAQGEARRKLLITAIALERFHVRHGSYPKRLDLLVPDVLRATPIDFMNGAPLHYSLRADNHFLLYSVGLNCKDDGAEMGQDAEARREPWRPRPFDPDIVWPLPASDAKASVHRAVVVKRVEGQLAAARERIAHDAAKAELARQHAVRRLLSNPKYQKTTWTGGDSKGSEPMYQGQPLSRFLRPGTNNLPLDSLLTLKQIITGDEPEIVTYQLPISYDLLASMQGGKVTNVFQTGELTLLMDCDPGDTFLTEPELKGCERATNGDCLLVWNTAFERPGQHVMQALFSAEVGPDTELQVKGPVKSYFSTNLLEFNGKSTLFNDRGANIFAQVVESNATYSIEIKTRAGQHVKTLTGTTTNGLIDVEWDLVDEKGGVYTNNSFETCFHVSLPRSRRSQTLKQIQNKLGTRGD